MEGTGFEDGEAVFVVPLSDFDDCVGVPFEDDIKTSVADIRLFLVSATVDCCGKDEPDNTTDS